MHGNTGYCGIGISHLVSAEYSCGSAQDKLKLTARLIVLQWLARWIRTSIARRHGVPILFARFAR